MPPHARVASAGGGTAARSLSRWNPLRWPAAYARWLHLRFPAGRVEPLPVTDQHGRTNIAGLYVVGDLSGVPLLKLSANAGVAAVRKIASELKPYRCEGDADLLDIAIIGGGTAGFAAALEARRLGLSYLVLEAAEPFSTIVNFPRAKPIYTYPTGLPVDGELTFHEKSAVKEGLLQDLREQTTHRGVKWRRARASHVRRERDYLAVVLDDGPGAAGVVRARRVIVAIGRSGNYRKLGVPGEALEKVYNRLHDPSDFARRRVLVVGGGDSAVETALALAEIGANVTLSYRGKELARPKPENVEKVFRVARRSEPGAALPDIDREVEPSDPFQAASVDRYLDDSAAMRGKTASGSLRLVLGSTVREIRPADVDLERANGRVETLPNDVVFAMIGRDPPLDFFRRSGVKIASERNARWWITLGAFLLFCFWLYHWKSGMPLLGVAGWALPESLSLDPAPLWNRLAARFAAAKDTGSLLYTLKQSASGRSFYYTLAYSTVVVAFGIARIRRRQTPYVTLQTLTLMAIQVVPLFILPEILLPWAGRNGLFEDGAGRTVADALFPAYSPDDLGERAYWRAYGLILAWPLFVYNWFTPDPLWGWLILGFLQTFVIIPAMIWFWGKGAYCGWICSCGALAETLGDRHRHKMPHGPYWNRLNLLGQVFLLAAVVLMGMRILGWMGWQPAAGAFAWGFSAAGPLSYGWFVDLLWAGILGVGLYFWFSGRVWCRFACPLAALMHVYHRFGRFAILADKKKCISCNVCTSVCHQGIDVMSFANKGLPMTDPQCVRCSACVQMCPTGVLQFGQIDRAGKALKTDPRWLWASPVIRRESAPVQLTVNGQSV